jgi:hypothetical protein
MPRALCLIFILCFAFTLSQCTQSPSLTSIQVIPAAPALTSFGETVQFKAIGSFQRAGTHPTVTNDITAQVLWASSNSNVSTITPTGLATADATGVTTVTASMGGVVGTAILNVSAQAVHDLTSITVIPGSQTVLSIGEPSQFIAIGTYTTAPMTQDVTNTVAWQSSDIKVATVNSAGLALANATGTTTITAIGTSNSGSSIPGSSTLTVQSSGGGMNLSLLTVVAVGLGQGTVTGFSNSAPTVTVINCPPGGGAGCTGNFTVGSTITLTAAPSAGSTFGGWSSNCVPDNAPTCSVVLTNNEPVGAIFN